MYEIQLFQFFEEKRSFAILKIIKEKPILNKDRVDSWILDLQENIFNDDELIRRQTNSIKTEHEDNNSYWEDDDKESGL